MLETYDPNVIHERDEERLETLADLAHTVLGRWHRATVEGVERIPDEPALYVGNHNGGLLSVDTFIAFAEVIRERGVGHAPYALAHSTAVRMPLVNQFLVPLGAVEASRENALRLLESGRQTLVYPGGDLESMRPVTERHQIKFGPRRGYIRLALEADVPIVPLVAAGAHTTFLVLGDAYWIAEVLGLDEKLRVDVWPVTLSIPWGLTVGPAPPYLPFPTKMAIEFMNPIAFERTGPEAAADDAYVEACARRVEERMQTTLDRLVETRL